MEPESSQEKSASITTHRQRSYSKGQEYAPEVLKRWKSAYSKLRSKAFDLDPWHDFKHENCQVKEAIRHRYSAIKKKWIKDNIIVKIENDPFDRGAMRRCYKLKKKPESGDWNTASNYVAKSYIDQVNSTTYFEDVRLQMEAKLWGEAYNRLNPPKKVDIFQLSVMEIKNSEGDNDFYHIERFMDGEYRKYNSNSGFVDEQVRNTPQAFSHFTFERSGHRLLVVDIQGVGDLYTDPQIHTSDGIGYSDGNLGLRGMAFFFHTHRCNPLCEWLGLAKFDLSESELMTKHPALVEIPKLENLSVNDVEKPNNHDIVIDSPIVTDIPQCENLNLSNSTLDGNESFVKKEEYFPKILPRRRTMSYNSPQKKHDNLDNYHMVFGSTVVRASEENLSTTSSHRKNSSSRIMSGDCSPIPLLRNRVSSKDSGISGHVSFAAKPVFFPPNEDNDSSLDLSLGSEAMHSETAFSPQLPKSNSQAPSSPHNWNALGINARPRRTRTTSESSDIDAEEVSRVGNAGLMHHLMHENQKPSCTDHPTNLDQEIGQSILGQIHHELARLHEAGRFVKDRIQGGWSCGLGAVVDSDSSSDVGPASTTSSKIDWGSVVFHETNAAQLGCLEAMIVMAHHYLGLPTALLYDCPIKSSVSDVGLGIDYLWRSAEGGDRRCMILLAQYLDSYATQPGGTTVASQQDLSNFSKFMTTPADLISLPKLIEARSSDKSTFSTPASALNPWSDALMWYRKCVDKAAEECSSDEGFDAEGRYDSANDLLPVYRILARMAEMQLIGGYGLVSDPLKAGYLFNEAGESAMSINQGQLALKYFELSEEAWALCPEDEACEASEQA